MLDQYRWKQGFGRVLGLTRFVVQQMAELQAGRNRDEVQTSTNNASLVKVSAIRARLLCRTCLRENEAFRFCQFCGNPCSAIESGNKTMHIDEKPIESRLRQFHRAAAAQAPVKSKNQTTKLVNRFLQSREGKGVKNMATAQPKRRTRFFCSLDACGERRRTDVLDIDCEAVGTGTSLESCKERATSWASQNTDKASESSSATVLAIQDLKFGRANPDATLQMRKKKNVKSVIKQLNQ